MSTLDTMTSSLSSPWCDGNGKPLAVRSLPGLRPEVLKTLETTYPGIIRPALRELLTACCGIADTELGHIDFTGCCFPEEPCAVFQPCLTLAIDDAGRRWIAEVGDQGLSGPVWCVFPEPGVAVYVSDDLATFIATLRDHACRGETLTWLQDLSTTARTVWAQRRALALRPYNAQRADDEIRGWLSTLPADAYVYDLRQPTRVRGWPYGAAGPSGRLFRCERLPVFAVAGSPPEGWRSRHPRMTSPIYPFAQQGAALAATPGLRDRRLRPYKPAHPRWSSSRPSQPRTGCGPINTTESRQCA
jgi:hypothetical protein